MKSLGVVLAVGVAAYLLSVIIPTAFTVKTLLPTTVFKFIQNHSPFFQEKKTLTLVEKLHNTGSDLNWLMHIYNDCKLDIFLKTEHDLDFQKASAYISKLQPNSETLVQLADQSSLVVIPEVLPSLVETSRLVIEIVGFI